MRPMGAGLPRPTGRRPGVAPGSGQLMVPPTLVHDWETAVDKETLHWDVWTEGTRPLPALPLNPQGHTTPTRVFVAPLLP